MAPLKGYEPVHESDVAVEPGHPGSGYVPVDASELQGTPGRAWSPKFGGRLPDAVINRIQQGTSLDKVFRAGAEAAATGWSNPAISADVAEQAAKWDQNVNVGPLRLFNQAIEAPVMGLYELFQRGMGALTAAAPATAAQAGTEVGGEQFGRAMGGVVESVMADAGSGGAPHLAALHEYLSTATGSRAAPSVSRVDVGADGAMRDNHVGPVPTPDQVPAQAAQVAQNYGLHDVTGYAGGPEAVPQSVYGTQRPIESGETQAPQYVSPSTPLSQRPPEATAAMERRAAEATAAMERRAAQDAQVKAFPNVSPETFKALAEDANLRQKHADIGAQIEALPEGDKTAVDRLNRLDAVETQLKKPDLTPEQRKSLGDRRDQILVDTTPEALKEAAAPIHQRAALEAQQVAIQQRLSDMADAHGKALTEAALTPPAQFTPAQVIGRLYHEDGVLPAEVHNDARVDPTVLADLALGQKPERYGGETPATDTHLEGLLQQRLKAIGPDESPAGVLSSEQAAADRRLASDAPVRQTIETEDTHGHLPGVYAEEGRGAPSGAETHAGEPRQDVATKEPSAPGAGNPPSGTTEQSSPRPGPAGPSQLLKPVSGTGELKTRGLSEGIEAKAIEEGLTTGFGDLPEYRTVSMADQAKRAAALIADDPELAKAIAMGSKPAPRGLLPESVLVAVEKQAIAAGDIETIRDLATQSRLSVEATTMGQRIRTLGERDPTSPIAAIQAVQDAREAALKGKDIKAEVAKVTKDAGAAIKAARSKVDAWASFVDGIKC